MFRSEKQQCEAIQLLLKSLHMERFWTDKGPTKQACKYLEGSPLSSGEQIFLRCAFDLWNGDGKVLGMFNVTSSGESTANESKFIFDRSGDDRTLTRIVTTETSFDVPRVNTKRRAVLAEKRQPKINNN